jgi:hypothetical protein
VRRESWECRFFFRALPAELTRERLVDRFGKLEGPLKESDTYLLGRDARLNLKVRARTESVKIRELLYRAEDGFELWRTPIDARLPAPAQIWRDVVARLSVQRDADRLATLSDPRDAVAGLCGATGDVRCVEVGKERVFFPMPPAHVELAEVVVAEGVFHSVAFESPDLALARSLRAEFHGIDLGAPVNYVGFCSRIASGRGEGL